MLKYLSKFVLEILPSLVATVIGAYIVNHYIVARPATQAPVAAAVSMADPKSPDPKTADAKTDAKSDVKADAKAVKSDAKSPDTKSAETPSDAASPPEPSTKKAAEKPTEKPTETASLPMETRRHQPAPREKTAKVSPAPVQIPPPAVAAVSVAPPVEASPTQDERRDANDIARAAIERLRGSTATEGSRADAPRVQDPPRVASAPPAPASVQPLPPAIVVSTPNGDAFNPNGTASPKPPYASTARVDDPRRPTPPADIPIASSAPSAPTVSRRPLDLHAEATASIPEHTTVADDMLSAAKSVFHAVLPH